MMTAGKLFEVEPGKTYVMEIPVIEELKQEELVHLMTEFEITTGSKVLVLQGGAVVGDLDGRVTQSIIEIIAQNVAQQLPYYSSDGVTVPIEVIPDLITGRQGVSANPTTTKENGEMAAAKKTTGKAAKASKTATVKVVKPSKVSPPKLTATPVKSSKASLVKSAKKGKK